MDERQIIRKALLNLDCACAGNEGKGMVCCLHEGLAAVDCLVTKITAQPTTKTEH